MLYGIYTYKLVFTYKKSGFFICKIANCKEYGEIGLYSMEIYEIRTFLPDIILAGYISILIMEHL